jgi:hypothetical protein
VSRRPLAALVSGLEHGPPYIDTYSVIEANGANRVFLCFVEKPGDDPIVVLFDGAGGHAPASWRGVVARADRVFAPGQLGKALGPWRRIASRAHGQARGGGGHPGARLHHPAAQAASVPYDRAARNGPRGGPRCRLPP